jgi:hypothetical protein
MFLKSEYFNKTVAVAAELFPTRDKIEHVLISAGVPVEAIKLQDSGIAMWDSAWSWADKNNKHLELVNIILQEFPNKQELIDIKGEIANGSAFITKLSYDQYIKPSPLPSTAKTFLIYDIEDFKENVEDLIMQLRLLEFPPSKIILYDMHNDVAGGNVKEERLKNIGESDIVLLMLTPRFFGNPKNDCLPLAFAAFEMKKWTIPVLLEDCRWNRLKLLENISPLPRNGLFVSNWRNKDQAHLEIVEGVERVVEVVKK